MFSGGIRPVRLCVKSDSWRFRTQSTDLVLELSESYFFLFYSDGELF
jgi:hypothetical protein